MIESKISGADEPRAINVKLETVSFQTFTDTFNISPFGRLTMISRSLEVITSMLAINLSAMMETPRNR